MGASLTKENSRLHKRRNAEFTREERKNLYNLCHIRFTTEIGAGPLLAADRLHHDTQF